MGRPAKERRTGSLPPSIEEAALALLRRSLRGSYRITPIAGDASTKAFFRVRTRSGTVVLLVNPDPLDAASPLISNHRILEAIGAPVPRILGRDEAAGLVLTEDLGDATLQCYLSGRSSTGAKGRPKSVPARSSRPNVRARRGHPARAWTDLYTQACDLIAL